MMPVAAAPGSRSCRASTAQPKPNHSAGVQSPGANHFFKMNISYKIAETKIAVLGVACDESKKEKPNAKRHARLMRLRERLAKLEDAAIKVEKEFRALNIE